MMVMDLLPVSIIEDRGFQQFLKVLDPKYTPPSRRTIMRFHLPSLYESRKHDLMKTLESITWCSFTTDLWTSRTTNGYITITCHYITGDWDMESAVLETAHVPEAHTGVNIADVLKKITDEWKISKKIHCSITDGGSNIRNAVKLNHWNNLHCFAHLLNLIVTDSISEVNEVMELISTVKRTVKFFKKSTKASEKLSQIQGRLNLPDHKLIQQVETRWNSVFFMLERYLEQHEAVSTTLCLQNRSDLVVSTEKNPIMAAIIEILRPFEVVTRELSSEKYVSASKVIPLARGLQRVTQSLLSRSAGIAEELCQRLSYNMGQRFMSIEDKNVLAISTLLDPRFKKIPFSSEGTVARMSRQIITDAAALTGQSQIDTAPPTRPPPSSNSVWEVFDQQVAASTSSRVPSISALTEFDQYIKLPVLPRNENPLQWWKNNSHVFPSLQQVARVYLSTVATSVPSERLFSKAGELISAKRNRIKPKNVNMILFLNKSL